MKWLPARSCTVSRCLALGALGLGLVTALPAIGHAATRSGETRTVTAKSSTVKASPAKATTVKVAARPGLVAAPAASQATSAACNDALVALGLCQPSRTSAQRSGGDLAAPAASAAVADMVGPPAGSVVVRASVPAHPVVAVAAPAVAVSAVAVPAVAAPVEAPGRLLPVFAFGLAIAGALLALFGVRALASAPGRAASSRACVGSVFGRLGKPATVTTAATAKERLLGFQAAPQLH